MRNKKRKTLSTKERLANLSAFGIKSKQTKYSQRIIKDQKDINREIPADIFKTMKEIFGGKDDKSS